MNPFHLPRPVRTATLLMTLLFLLAACGGGGGGNGTPPPANNDAVTTLPDDPASVDTPASDPAPDPTPDPATFTVTASAGAGGAISPASATVAHGSTASFTVTPDNGYAIDSVSGCGGALAGNTFTTGPVTADCAVSARFRLLQPTSAAVPILEYTPVKTFRFTWNDVDGATFYRLLEDPDGSSGFSQVGADIATGIEQFDLEVPLHRRLNARYILQSCNAGGCTDSSTITVDVSQLADAIGYVKASNTGADDYFGYAVALSSDGSTLAVGARGERSDATGIDGADNDNAISSGAVYVFVRASGAWSQQAYIKASNTGAGDGFGTAVALSADGDTLAVGAIYEDSDATGIGGADNDNASASGAVYVFIRAGGAWSQQAYVKAANTGANDFFGTFVDLSADGDTLAVGAPREDSDATGIGGANNDNAADSGAVYVYIRSNGAWNQQAYVKASNTGIGDRFGAPLTLSADGDTLAVGAPFEDSDATGIGGNQSNDNATDSGAVYVFTRSGSTWSQQAYIKASNTGANDSFGANATLSFDGDTLAVGAPFEDSNATGIGGDQSNDNAANSGAVYVFTRSGATWSQQAYVKASNTGTGDDFGYALALSADGDTMAVGAIYEDSDATGIGGADNDNASASGAVYVFVRAGGAWSQQTYVKASNTGQDDVFGSSVALSADGDTMAVGAYFESSDATGIGGNDNDNADDSGAVYLY